MSEPNEIHAPFEVDVEQLLAATVRLVGSDEAAVPSSGELPHVLPEAGLGAPQTLELLAGPVLDDARDLGAPGFFAHMDPPTPWLTWAMHLWTASRNQNLLHPDTAPQARDMERRVIDWLAPYFSMNGGHMTPGSTIANLTALWAAREAGAHTVVSTENAHVSIAKVAHLLGMFHRRIRSWDRAPIMQDSVAVITAGTTTTGEIEPLDAVPGAPWRHVDAAWAGPLALSDRHRHLLTGLEFADSVAVSAHKWLFQPKESAMVLFADADAAHRSITFGADYLTAPNVGVLGSHGASAVPLLATLMAYGRVGVASWIDHSMSLADQLARIIEVEDNLQARTPPQSGVVNWQHRSVPAQDVVTRLPADVFLSTADVDGHTWLRSVAANPMADPQQVARAVASLV